MTTGPFDEKRWREREADLFTYSFFFLRLGESPRGEDAGRWVRDKVADPDIVGWELANGDFWLHRDPHEVLLVAVLQGDILNLDNYSGYGDQPDIADPDWQRQLEVYNGQLRASPRLGKPFTVLCGWQTDPTGFKRYLKYTEGIDARHAELLARSETQAGTFLVSAVVGNHVPTVDSSLLDVYCTPDGRPLPATVPQSGQPAGGHHGLFHRGR